MATINMNTNQLLTQRLSRGVNQHLPTNNNKEGMVHKIVLKQLYQIFHARKKNSLEGVG
jgi:hypothetical protein